MLKVPNASENANHIDLKSELLVGCVSAVGVGRGAAWSVRPTEL